MIRDEQKNAQQSILNTYIYTTILTTENKRNQTKTTTSIDVVLLAAYFTILFLFSCLLVCTGYTVWPKTFQYLFTIRSSSIHHHRIHNSSAWMLRVCGSLNQKWWNKWTRRRHGGTMEYVMLLTVLIRFYLFLHFILLAMTFGFAVIEIVFILWLSCTSNCL